jgi:hypothetical protein
MIARHVATRASARGRSVSSSVRIKVRKRFRCPKRFISCIQPPSNLAVSAGVCGTKEGAQPVTLTRNKLVFLRNVFEIPFIVTLLIGDTILSPMMYDSRQQISMNGSGRLESYSVPRTSNYQATNRSRSISAAGSIKRLSSI